MSDIYDIIGEQIAKPFNEGEAALDMIKLDLLMSIHNIKLQKAWRQTIELASGGVVIYHANEQWLTPCHTNYMPEGSFEVHMKETPYMLVGDGKEVHKCDIIDGMIQRPKNKP